MKLLSEFKPRISVSRVLNTFHSNYTALKCLCLPHGSEPFRKKIDRPPAVEMVRSGLLKKFKKQPINDVFRPTRLLLSL
jgi:hypothetical protein